MKLKRLLSIICAAIMICVLFSGCKALDKARDAHAYYTDKTRKEITLKGKTYKLLPTCDDLHPAINYAKDHHTISQKDVPILITLMGAQEGVYTARNGELLCADYYDANYARSDVYDKYVKLISEYKLDNYAYWKSEYKDGIHISTLEIIDDKDVELISAAESTGVKQEIPQENYDDPTFECLFVLTDSTTLFSRESIQLMYMEADRSVYLLFIDRGVTYKVSEDYTKPLYELIQKCNYTAGEPAISYYY